MIVGKKILVAGGTGLVGTNLVKKLDEMGADVSASYYQTQPKLLLEKYKRFDFTNIQDCIEATSGQEYVFITAALTFGSKVMKENPTAFLLPNMNIVLGLLEACYMNKVKKVVLLSSTTVYQESYVPLEENDLDLNISPYNLYFGVGWLNRYYEQMAKLYQMKYDMEVGIVRPTSIYGPFDKFDDHKSNVIPALIKRAMNKENPFIVWGNGFSIRDFIYVEDLVEDLIDVIEKNHCNCDPINLGSGMGTSIREAVEIILDVCHHDMLPEYDETKPTAIPYRMVNVSKAESLLGKKQRIDFKEGIRRTVEWYKQYMHKHSS